MNKTQLEVRIVEMLERGYPLDKIDFTKRSIFKCDCGENYIGDTYNYCCLDCKFTATQKDAPIINYE